MRGRLGCFTPRFPSDSEAGPPGKAKVQAFEKHTGPKLITADEALVSNASLYTTSRARGQLSVYGLLRQAGG